MQNDSVLSKYGIKIELGRVHNVNKNPVAENAVKEYNKERLRLNPKGGPVSEIEKCIIMRNMNLRIRDRGLAAKEILLRRDLITNKPKEVDDEKLSKDQVEKRKAAHPINEKAKATFKTVPADVSLKVGDHVFIKSDLSKLRVRE